MSRRHPCVSNIRFWLGPSAASSDDSKQRDLPNQNHSPNTRMKPNNNKISFNGVLTLKSSTEVEVEYHMTYYEICSMLPISGRHWTAQLPPPLAQGGALSCFETPRSITITLKYYYIILTVNQSPMGNQDSVRIPHLKTLQMIRKQQT